MTAVNIILIFLVVSVAYNLGYIAGNENELKKECRKMMEESMEMVEFNKYCGKCKYESQLENEFPCDECLENAFNYGTDKPVKYEEKDGNK